MSRTILLAVSIALQMLLGGCLPVTTSSPLGTTVAAAPDPQLTGVWKGNLGNSRGAVYVAVYPEHEGIREIVVLTPPAADDDGGWLVFQARAATLGGNTYLDAREMEEDGKAADPKLSHVPILYNNADGFFAIYLLNEKAARLAIRRRAIAGTIEPGEFGDVTITAAPAALDAFFASKAGRALFTKPLGILRRAN